MSPTIHFKINTIPPIKGVRTEVLHQLRDEGWAEVVDPERCRYLPGGPKELAENYLARDSGFCRKSAIKGDHFCNEHRGDVAHHRIGHPISPGWQGVILADGKPHSLNPCKCRWLGGRLTGCGNQPLKGQYFCSTHGARWMEMSGVKLAGASLRQSAALRAKRRRAAYGSGIFTSETIAQPSSVSPEPGRRIASSGTPKGVWLGQGPKPSIVR